MARLPTLRTIIRGLLQVWAWLLLVFLFAADYKTAEYLKHGPTSSTSITRDAYCGDLLFQ